LRDLYADAITRRNEKYADWCTPIYPHAGYEQASPGAHRPLVSTGGAG
jgi:hypothetical protein